MLLAVRVRILAWSLWRLATGLKVILMMIQLFADLLVHVRVARLFAIAVSALSARGPALEGERGDPGPGPVSLGPEAAAAVPVGGGAIRVQFAAGFTSSSYLQWRGKIVRRSAMFFFWVFTPFYDLPTPRLIFLPYASSVSRGALLSGEIFLIRCSG